MNAVFVKLVNMSVAAGWLILAVLVLRLLLKKAPRWITCLLWAMVAVRLVCPISLQSPVSAYQVAAPAAVQESGQVEYFHYVYESGDKPSIQLDVDAIRPAEAIPAQPQTTPEQSAAAEPVQETAGRSDPTRYLPPLVTVWLAVGGALLLYGLGSTLRLRLRVREAMRLRDNIWVCDAVTSPFLLGLFRPRVYLPSGMDGAQLDYVLAHEQAHLRRGDHVWATCCWRRTGSIRWCGWPTGCSAGILKRPATSAWYAVWIGTKRKPTPTPCSSAVRGGGWCWPAP